MSRTSYNPERSEIEKGGLQTEVTNQHPAEQCSMPSEQEVPPRLEHALEWYNNCHRNHDQCNVPATVKAGWVPTRLIQLSSSSEKAGYQVHWKLVKTDNKTSSLESPGYMTISYRRGPRPGRLQLLASNAHEFAECIPYARLPQLFKDFAAVARRFNVQYIWIDALCVVQDSLEDWETEVSDMGFVYLNAVCNVAAAASSGPEEGLFRAKGVFSSWSVPGPVSMYRAYVGKNFWDKKVKCGPLYRRGWVFQELQLAPRTLYFSADELVWECLAEARCETFPRGVPNHTPNKHTHVLWKPEEVRATMGMCYDWDWADRIWGDIVADYSRCVLTSATDKMPAITGLANVFAIVAESGIQIEGFMAFDIPTLLDWRVETPVHRRTAEYLAPSWSWASVDCPVQPAQVKGRTMYHLLRFCGSSHGRESHLRRYPLSSFHGFLTRVFIKFPMYRPEPGEWWELETATCRMRGQFFKDTLEVSLEKGREQWILPLMLKDKKADDITKRYMTCLALEPVLCFQGTHFRRVGLLILHHAENRCPTRPARHAENPSASKCIFEPVWSQIHWGVSLV